MKEQGIKVETYVQSNTLSNDDGEQLDESYLCSHEGHKKMDARVANVHNISTETRNHSHLPDAHGSSKY